jgi:quercetin dioxygenase-like cupin family protein
MAIPHLKSGEQAELALGKGLPGAQTTTLLKTDAMEVIRLVLPAGKEIAEHKAPGEITVQCLEGKVLFTAHGEPRELAAGKFLYLSTAEPHALKAQENSSLLVTILLGK